MRTPQKYRQTEIGSIPEDWEVKKLGDIGDVKMCRRVFNSETTSNGAIPFYKIGTFGKEPDSYISRELYNDYRRRFSFPSKGDILISAAGTIGRTIIYDGKDAYYQDSNIIWIENNQSIISNIFLYHTLQVVKYNTEGGTIQRLYNSILKATKFICPSPAEQTAIANALNDADALITQLEKLIAKKRLIKQGAMQELLKPKEGWVEKKFIEIISKDSGIKIGPFGSQLKKELLVNEGFKVYGQENIFEASMDLGNRYLSKEHFNKLKSCELLSGDFIISMMGTIGKCMIVPNNIQKGIMDSHLIRLRLNKTILDINYFYHYFSSEIILYQVERLSVGGIMAGLSSKIIKNLQIVLPPTLKQQTQIAETLSEMDAEIAGLEKKLEKYRKIKEGMMQNLLTGKIRLI